MKILSASIVVILALASCNSAEEETTSSAPLQATPAAVSATPSITANDTQSSARIIPSINTPPPPIVLNPALATGSKGAVNPPHGQPGHRCDIAVGAPLTGPGAPAAPVVPVASAIPAASAVPAVTQPAVTAPAQPAVPVTVNSPTTPAKPGAKGVNPPHGQPGHRCDIAVGAPLPASGAPAASAIPAASAAPAASAVPALSQPAATSPAPPAIPVTLNSPSTPAKPGAKGVNPAHGQPGHRCDIAVGAPLN